MFHRFGPGLGDSLCYLPHPAGPLEPRLGRQPFFGGFLGPPKWTEFSLGKWMENDGTCHQKRCMMTGGMEDIVMGL